MKNPQKAWAYRFNAANPGFWVGIAIGAAFFWPWKYCLIDIMGFPLLAAIGASVAGFGNGFLGLMDGKIYAGFQKGTIHNPGNVTGKKTVLPMAHGYIGFGVAGLVRAILIYRTGA